jgi:Holliday junction resolvase RusA-like endonuclease
MPKSIRQHMCLLTLTILGDPVPKGRPKKTSTHVYTPQRTRDAEEKVRQLAQINYRKAPYAGPVGIDVVFYCATRRRCDGDNLVKLITDAIQRGRRENGGVILDDSQIEDWHCRIYRAKPGEAPRTELRLYPLAEDK